MFFLILVYLLGNLKEMFVTLFKITELNQTSVIHYLLCICLKYNMNLNSVLFTWFSSIIGLALMPINLKLWFNLINFQSDIVVPYVQVFCTIVFFIIPVIAGSLVGRRFPQKVDAMKKVRFLKTLML